uniref:PPM-type phosphatase domain-containing protein n=1 Tax=Phaeomonas parva TaxID=124430 RepID=A0A7S1TVS3_9STRA|mmetsp:Transcript_19501/g.58984  ORF Transcript_19501/g.58984 Transcript_19501/m.58984 type:complete len:233 (+) Transcript_19501:424-1122(+)
MAAPSDAPYTGDLFRCACAHEEMNPAKRNTMEDAHVVQPDLLGDGTASYFGVYDGHGGRGIVEYVEEHLHVKVAEELRAESADKQAALKRAFQITDAASNQTGITTGGATAAVGLICTEGSERVLYTAGVGDSRAVLCRGGEAFRLTVDHKTDNDLEKMRVEKAGGFFMRDRLLGILAVTRSFGDHGMKDFVTAEPDTNRVVLTPNDTMLIIACDGVWDVLSDQGAVDFISG